MPDAPVPYDPSLEVIETGEAETIEAIDATMAKIRARTLVDEGRPLRSVHAKSHGFIVGELTIADDLPPAYAQGLFARPGRHPVVLRSSTIPGDLLDDAVSTPRGLAMKVLGVTGEPLTPPGGTQDFVMVDAPAFNAASLKKFLGALRLVAATTDRAEGGKKALSVATRAAERVVEAFGGRSASLLALGGHRPTHVLGETYHTQVPIRFGDHVAKLALVPVSPELLALKDVPVDLHDHPDALREAVVAFFARHGATWHLRAQLCTDLEAMPIEDPTVVWPEGRSPFVTVAVVTAGPQVAWSVARAAAVDDGMSFSPWHGLVAHRPLGAVMRARRVAYVRSAQFRAAHQGQTVTEPTDLAGL